MMAGPAAAEAGSDSRERILRAALEAFSQRGFDGATTREIAAHAGVPLGLLQYHFGGKPKLWRAAASPADERERMQLLIRGHVEFVARNPEFVRLMHDEGKRRGPRMRWMVDRHVKPLYTALAPLIQRSQEVGLLPAGIAPIHFVYILAGAVGVIFHQAEECKRLAGVDPFDRAAVEAHSRAVEHLFLGAPGVEAPG
jgi:AcrR family transcriptional regulator